MSKSSSEVSHSSETQQIKSTIMTEPILSVLENTTQQPSNLVLMPTTETSSPSHSPSGDHSSFQASEVKSSKKPNLKSKVGPEDLLKNLESQQEGQVKSQLKILEVKKSDLEAFKSMLKEFEEIMHSKL
jgi:hypothetical protein